MRIAAFLLIGMATVATANAQTSPARVVFLPMPNTLPTLLFAPDPLAGTLLRPLTGPSPASTAFSEVAPESDVVAVAAAVPPPPNPAPAPEDEPPPDSTDHAAVEPAPETLTAVEPPPAVESPPAAAVPPGTTITVIVENVESASGNVNVAICDKGLSREGCPYVQEIPAQQGFVETEFKDIPPGSYAVVGYHDVNGNDQFDKMMGIPREPYALSNHASEKLVPTFADAELPIKSGENAVIIRLKRLGG